ncbi:DUF1573 domain-containing protein [Sphingobacterium hungaricum]
MNITNIALIGLLSFSVISCNQASKNSTETADSSSTETVAANENAGIGTIEFPEREYDFGTIKEGEVVEHVFTFNNTGTAPVILAQVSATCGCTTPEYTSVPVKPGASGEIKVHFDSNGQAGQQQKIVTIRSNAENSAETVQIKGTVTAK